MDRFSKSEICPSGLQLEVQPSAEIGFEGSSWLLWFEEILANASDFLGVLLLPFFVGIIYFLNIFMFKSFKLKSEGSRKKLRNT